MDTVTVLPHLEKLWFWLFPPVEQTGGQDRSAYERFALPFTFKPRLSVFEAMVAVTGALLRIFLGWLLFAVWGTYTLFAWHLIHNLFLRAAAVTVLLVLFLFFLVLLLISVAFLTRMASPKRNGTVIPL